MPPLGLIHGTNPGGGRGGSGPGRGGRGGGGPGFYIWEDIPTNEEIIRRRAMRLLTRTGLHMNEIIRFLNQIMAAIRGWIVRRLTGPMLAHGQNSHWL